MGERLTLPAGLALPSSPTMDDGPVDLRSHLEQRDGNVVWPSSFHKCLNRRNADGYTALSVAVRCGNLPAVTSLLDAKADTSVRDNYRTTALYDAVMIERADICLALLGARANPLVIQGNNLTPLSTDGHFANGLSTLAAVLAHFTERSGIA